MDVCHLFTLGGVIGSIFYKYIFICKYIFIYEKDSFTSLATTLSSPLVTMLASSALRVASRRVASSSRRTLATAARVSNKNEKALPLLAIAGLALGGSAMLYDDVSFFGL